MQPFSTHTGVAAPLVTANIDTDQIIPSREMKTVSKSGLGIGLFAGWRYEAPDSRAPNPGFILNLPPFDQASILISGANFGCGSSREHAVWALVDFGIRVVIAESFGEIFFNNCISNGVLPIALRAEEITALASAVKASNGELQVTADLPSQSVSAGEVTVKFDILAGTKSRLLKGLDAIGETLEHADTIRSFLTADQKKRPWAYALNA